MFGATRRFSGRAVVLGVLPLALFASSARADDAEEEVLVRGGQSAGFVSHARMDDAPREVTDAASLVAPLPGVHVRRLGADDSFATLSIRGSSSTQVAAYLAGVPLSGGADPTLDLATLPLWPGAQAKVHRSFAPAALGRGSLGGTLVIEPPSPRAPNRSEVWAAAGSFGGRRVRVGDVRGDPDGVRVATGLSASRSDGDFTFFDSHGSGGRDAFATRENAGHAAASGLVSVGIPVRMRGGIDGALTITTLAQARRQELPGSLGALTPSQRLASSRLVSALELTIPVGPRTTFVSRGWGRREGLALSDDPRTARLSPSSTDDAILAAGASTGFRARPTEDTLVELRVDGSGERFAPGTWVGGTAPPSARRTNAGVALDASARVLGSLALAASARGDAWIDSSDAGPTKSVQQPSGHLGVELPVGWLVAASHAGFVARPPSFVELYGNRGGFIGNQDLRRESAFTVDLGVRTTRRFGVVKLHAEVAGFATWAEDLIVFVPKGAFDRYAEAANIGEARLVGMEAAGRAAVHGFEARVSYTALDTANLSECNGAGGACQRPPLPGRPAHDVVGDLSWQRGPLRLRYGVDVVAGIRVSVKDDSSVPPRVLHGAGVRLDVPWARGLSVGLDVQNLFDLRTADYPGVSIGGRPQTDRRAIGDLFDYPLPGRSALLSARWTSPSAQTR